MDPFTLIARAPASAPASPDGPALGGNEPFRSAAPRLLEERLHALYAFEEFTSQPEAVTELHDMRIAAKWLRYTMELFAPAYADELKKSIAAVKKLQELLGDLHDSDVRIDLLRAALGGRLRVRGLEAIGQLSPDPVHAGLNQLLARELRTRQGCYRAFYKEWKKLQSRGFQKTCTERIRNPDAPTAPAGEQVAGAGAPGTEGGV
jgi:CHAD domain-containing protein